MDLNHRLHDYRSCTLPTELLTLPIPLFNEWYHFLTLPIFFHPLHVILNPSLRFLSKVKVASIRQLILPSSISIFTISYFLHLLIAGVILFLSLSSCKHTLYFLFFISMIHPL